MRCTKHITKNILLRINTIKNIVSCRNKYSLRVFLSVVLPVIIMLILSKDAFIISKLGKTLFFILTSLCIYFALGIPGLLKKNKIANDYNVVDDFYKVICEDSSTITEPALNSSSSGVKVRDKTLAISLTERNVMIGTVRSSHQLKYNLENNCYYAPAKFVEKENLPLKSIAIYEDDKTGNMSIKRMGYVKTSKLVKRKNIPIPISRNNPDEEYWLFELDSWEELKKPIIVKDTYRGKPIYTNSFLIENCDYSYQLVSINSPGEYILAKAVESFLNSHNNSHSAVKISNKRMLEFKDNRIIVKNNRGTILYKMPADLYSQRPKQMFDKLKAYIK